MLGSMHLSWSSYSLLVLALLAHCGNSLEPRRKYNLFVKMQEYSNPESKLLTGRQCDPEDTSSCDVQIKLWVKCDDCVHGRPVFYPNEERSYENRSQLGTRDFGEKALYVTLDTTSEHAVDIHLAIIDYDYDYDSFPDHVASGKITIPADMKIKQKEWSVEWSFNSRDTTKSQYAKAKTLMNIECARSTCGDACVALPSSNFTCDSNNKLVCLNGYYYSGCDVFEGNVSWSVNLLHYETNYEKLQLNDSCYEVARACVYENCLEPVPIGWNSYASPTNQIVRQKDTWNLTAAYINVSQRASRVNISVTTYCHGAEVASEIVFFAKAQLTKASVFKFSRLNRLLFGVITSCYQDDSGWQCLHALNSNSASQVSCSRGESSVVCAYMNLCNYCYNGGSCMLLRSNVDVDAYEHNQPLDRELGDYSAECECTAGYRGRQCQEEVVKT